MEQLMTKELTRMRVLVSGKLQRMPQVTKRRDPICGSVADTGDLTSPTSPWRISRTAAVCASWSGRSTAAYTSSCPDRSSASTA